MSQIASIQIAPRRSAFESIAALINSRSFQLMTLLSYAFFLNREGVRVPSGNELVYLLYVYKAWHPHFMAGDWTFLEPTAGHGFFNLASGWLTLLMPLEWAAWVGRFACWVLSFIGLLRLGRHFQIPSWGIWLGVLLWMVQRQALPTTPWTEWIVGSFEAKCPAYICLIFALDAALRQRPVLAGLLAGLAFSFHSAVGMWGGVAIGWAIVTHLPMRKSALFCAAAIATALPGLLSSLPLVTGSHAINPTEAQFLVTRALPLCLDPFAMEWPYVALLVLMLLFGWQYRRQRGGQTASMLFQFQLALAACFEFGFVARALGRFDLVKLYPMRVFAVLTMLFFFWQLIWVASQALKLRRHNAPALLVTSLGLVIFLGLPSPVARVAAAVAAHLQSRGWTVNPAGIAADADLDSTTDFRAAASWIAQNTACDDLVIAPPWRADAYYFIRRPLVANWHAYRYDAMTAWRKRIESLAGDLSHLKANDPPTGDMDLVCRSHYRSLSTADITGLQYTYNAGWIITTGKYPFPLVFSSPTYKVYHLQELRIASAVVCGHK